LIIKQVLVQATGVELITALTTRNLFIPRIATSAKRPLPDPFYENALASLHLRGRFLRVESIQHQNAAGKWLQNEPIVSPRSSQRSTRSAQESCASGAVVPTLAVKDRTFASTSTMHIGLIDFYAFSFSYIHFLCPYSARTQPTQQTLTPDQKA
jgi:hypothetical protein